MADAVSYDEYAQRWSEWREALNRTLLKFAPADMPLVTLRPADINYTTLLGRLAFTRRALAEVEIARRRVEADHAECRAMLVRAIMDVDPKYTEAKNDAARRAVLDLRLDADDYAGSPLAGSAIRTGYRQTKQRLAALRDEETRLATELTIIRDERRMFETLADYNATEDERYEARNTSQPETE